jgi:hypothetical protein
MSEELNKTEREEFEQLKKDKENSKNRILSLKVSQKGAVSLYGLGRFPVTLYKEQWEKVFPFIEDIKDFIAENAAELKTK